MAPAHAGTYRYPVPGTRAAERRAIVRERARDRRVVRSRQRRPRIIDDRLYRDQFLRARRARRAAGIWAGRSFACLAVPSDGPHPRDARWGFELEYGDEVESRRARPAMIVEQAETRTAGSETRRSRLVGSRRSDLHPSDGSHSGATA